MEIDVNVIIGCEVKLGNRVRSVRGLRIENCVIGDDVDIKPIPVIEDATIGERAANRSVFSFTSGDRIYRKPISVTLWKSKSPKSAKVQSEPFNLCVGDAEIGSNCNIGGCDHL